MIEIRECSQSDLLPCSALLRNVYAEPPYNEAWGESGAAEYLEAFFRIDPRGCFVAVDQEGIIGSIFSYSYPWSTGVVLFIQELFVSERGRRKGVGRGLVASAVESKGRVKGGIQTSRLSCARERRLPNSTRNSACQRASTMFSIPEKSRSNIAVEGDASPQSGSRPCPQRWLPCEVLQLSRVVVARALSLLGHPALLMPAMFLFGVIGNDTPAMALQFAVVSSIFVGISIVAYSWGQVRAGRWSVGTTQELAFWVPSAASPLRRPPLGTLELGNG